MNAVAKVGEPIQTGKPPRYVTLNRNLGNFPLARDPRRKADWQLSKSWWGCALPGDERIHLYLPGSWSHDQCRLPSGFDMAVLCQLLATARLTEKDAVTVAGVADLLRLLGVADNWLHRRRVKDALELWQALHLTFDQWYVAHPVRAHQMVKLRPPLMPVQATTRRAQCFKLDADWLRWQATFFEKIRLPLPVNAAAQNIVLTVRCGVGVLSDDPADNFSGRRFAARVHVYARKIGLEHRHRTTLQKALDEASSWYVDNKGMLLAFFQDGRIVLKETIPEVANQYLAKVPEPVALVEKKTPPVRIPFEFTNRVIRRTDDDPDPFEGWVSEGSDFID